MASDLNQAGNKQHAYRLLDRLEPDQLAAIIRLLETFVAPDEDSALATDAERKAVAEADEWLRQNDPIPNEAVLAEFGLTADDWEKMGQAPPAEDAPHRRA